MSLFEKVNIPDCIVIIGLVTALILAIFYALNELAMSSVRASRLHRRHREVRRSSERRRKT